MTTSVSGMPIIDYGVPPPCPGCSLPLTNMSGRLVCVCCGSGALAPDRGCRHVPWFEAERLRSLAVPLSCEDVEPGNRFIGWLRADAT